MPKIFGNKKPDQPYEYPDEQRDKTEAQVPNEDERPWYTWGLPEEEKEMQPEPKVEPKVEPNSVFMEQLKKSKQKVTVVGRDRAFSGRDMADNLSVKTPHYNTKSKVAAGLKLRDIRRGVIMAEVLGKPRALKPYSDKVE